MANEEVKGKPKASRRVGLIRPNPTKLRDQSGTRWNASPPKGSWPLASHWGEGSGKGERRRKP